MKSRLVAVLLVVVLAAGAGFVFGVAIGGDSSKNLPLPPNIVVVSGQGTVSTAPDKATVSLGVNTTGATAEEALQANATQMDAVLKALADAGIEEKDIQTQNMNVNKHVENRGTKQETTNYVANQQLSVVIHDVTKVGSVIDSAVKAGANDVGGIEFGLTDAATSKNAAFKEAVAVARTKAETLAAAAGASVGSVVRIDENSYDVQTNFARYDMMAAPLAATDSTTVSPGQVQTDVSVRVTYQLVPGS
jgi:hypothetical protein